MSIKPNYMIKVIEKAPENVAAFKAKGKVTGKDFDTVFATVDRKISEHGELNYLMQIDGSLKNWESMAWVKDLFLGLKHFIKWNRCAMVSDNKVVEKVTELSKFLPGIEFKHFFSDELEDALHWVSTGKEKEHGTVGTALLAGIAGAAALTIANEFLRHRYDNVPRVNEVGEEAVEKILAPTDIHLNDKELYATTLVGDILSNALYYAATATNGTGLISGLFAGIGAVELPKYLGLNDQPVASTDQKKVMTIAYYTLGGVVAGLIYSSSKTKKK